MVLSVFQCAYSLVTLSEILSDSLLPKQVVFCRDGCCWVWGRPRPGNWDPPPWLPGWRTVVPPVRGVRRPGCGAVGNAFLMQTRGPLMGRHGLGWPLHHAGHLGTRLWGCGKPSLRGHLWGGRIGSPEGGACPLLWGFGLCPVSQVVVIVLLTEQVRKQAKGWC